MRSMPTTSGWAALQRERRLGEGGGVLMCNLNCVRMAKGI